MANTPVVSYYAVLVGIDAYPDKPLKSCTRDTEVIRTILERQSNGLVNIQSLTASAKPPTGRHVEDKAPELEPDWPTSRNVIAALREVTTQAKPGDCVYIHYSGHGTRTKPCFDLSNQTTGDLALVLLQGHESPDIYLRGPQLAHLIKAMTDKGLVVTLVLDCCFSATVYRRSNADDNVRFHPHDADAATSPQNPHGVTTDRTPSSGYRDGSMRDNWLISPEHYTILAACGPHENAKGGFDVVDKARSYGTLSYFLSKSLSDHGLNRRHRDIHRHICAVFRQYCIPQNPILYGNGDQGFFGQVGHQRGVRQTCVMKRDKGIQLLAGQAHGVCQGDRFTLISSKSMYDRTVEECIVAEVTKTNPLTSDLRLLDMSHNVQTGWVAEPLSSFHLSKFPFHLAPDLPGYGSLLRMLQQRHVGSHIPLEKYSTAEAIRVTLSSKNEYVVLDDSLKGIVHIPTIQRGEEEIESICSMMEHLTRFKMVKDLSNESPTNALRETVRVVMAQGQQTFEPHEQVQVQHGRPVQLIVSNRGGNEIYAHVYNLGPGGRVKNIFGGTYVPIPPQSDANDTRELGVGCTGTYTAKVRMEVPPVLQADGSCMDIIKVFITTKATSFESLELPNLQQLAKQDVTDRDAYNQPEGVEDWVAYNFCVYTHLKPEFHVCPRWEDADAYDPLARDAESRELTELIEMINTRALEARASHLRRGRPCSIPPLQYDRAIRSSVMGGMNYHIEVRFDDGVTWIARIRRFNATSPPRALRDDIIQSEVATLMFLEHTGVPAPKVYDFALEHPENPVGVGFILMDKLPGKSLRWSVAAQEQKNKVMDQLADVFVELHKHPFDLLGSLDSPGSSHVGAFARESLTNFVQSQMHTTGPCSSLEEYHMSSIRLILELIIQEEMYSQQAVDAYLIHRYLIDLVPRVLPLAHGDEKFYLKHADDKGDHILVDEQFNITGIIDWEWAHTASPAHAFNSPIALLPVADFYSAKNNLGDDEVVFAHLLEEKGHRDLARFVWDGRLQHRFAFCCGYDLADWDGFLGLFRGLRDAVGVDEDLEWNEWKMLALQRYEDDAGLQLLLAKHQV
ncbi:hypothetical protein F66182_6055 [Fusarium sp. NRRL 66182]|nr:hypothetical protein F66182_6055 [Fusarium sp. NRRL 66182]